MLTCNNGFPYFVIKLLSLFVILTLSEDSGNKMKMYPDL